MAAKKEETASFVLRFTQKIFHSEAGEAEVQWRGSIRHVQTGHENRFSNFEEARTFVQDTLSDLTLSAVEDKSPEEQKGILAKSLDLWKKAPQIVRESIKDPKKQVAHLQEQLQEQIHIVGDAIGQKIEDTIGQKVDLDDWRSSTRSDYKNIVTLLEEMQTEMRLMNEKIEQLTAKKGKKPA